MLPPCYQFYKPFGVSSLFRHAQRTFCPNRRIELASLRPWSSWTANSDKKYMELNATALNVLGNQPFRKISRGRN